MKEKTLLTVALIVSLAGIATLYIISNNIEVSESQIDKINKNNIGEIVKVKGRVENVAQNDEVLFLKISQPSEIDVIVFHAENLSLYPGNSVEVLGKIEEYNGKTEIIAQRIRVI